jgi:hypothetical protein
VPAPSAAHITAFPPLEISLPWETPNGKQTAARLLLYSLRHFYASVLLVVRP